MKFSTLSLAMLGLLAAPLLRAETEVRVPASFQRLQKAIGLEPTGGQFETLIPVGARVGTAEAEGSVEFALGSRRQPSSIFSLYATNAGSVWKEAPLARYQIGTLREGRIQNRVKVTVSVGADRILHVSATDLERPGDPLQVTLLTSARLASGRLPAVAKPEGPAPVADVETTLKRSVGLRVGGGMYQPLLRAGALPSEKATFRARLRYRGQTTADLFVYEGESPFIEKNKLKARYIVSGIPASQKLNTILIEARVSQKGKLEPLRVTDLKGQEEYHVEPYTESAARRLREKLQESSERDERRVPGSPEGLGGA